MYDKLKKESIRLFGKTINVFDAKTNLDDLNNIYVSNNLISNNNLDYKENNLTLNDGIDLGIYNIINQLRKQNEGK